MVSDRRVIPSRRVIPKREIDLMERRVTHEHLVPIPGCWIRRPGTQQLGEVRDSRSGVNGLQIKVRWGGDIEEWLALADVEPGFQLGWMVQTSRFQQVGVLWEQVMSSGDAPLAGVNRSSCS
jgi:hypothetical protein